MLITGNFYRLAVKGEQADDPADVLRCQAGVGVEGKGVILRKTNNTATRIIVVIMRLEATLGWRGWFKAFVEIVVAAIPDGVPVRFAIGKRHGVNQEVVAYFEEDADFCGFGIHCKANPDSDFAKMFILSATFSVNSFLHSKESISF